MAETDRALPPPVKNLRRRAAGAARWTAVSAAMVTAIQFVNLVVLTRLLEPRAFGLMALVLIVLSFAQLLGQMGLSAALIQRKDPTREELSSLYWLNVALSLAALVVLWAASPLVAWIFEAPPLKEILPVAALSFLIVPFGFQFRVLAQKTLRFRLLAGVEIATAATTLIIAVSSAWLFDQGIWSLVWGYLAGSTAGAAILAVGGWRAGSTRPRLHFRRKDLAGYLSFGLYQTGAASISFFNLRFAQLLVGALLGAQALGYYSVASNLVLQPIQKLNPVLTRAAFPVFSLVQDDMARLRRGYLEMIRLMMFLNAPVSVGAAAVAPTAVPLLLGKQWIEAVPLVQALAFYALLRTFGNAEGSLQMARGRADWSFYWQVATLLVIPLTVYLASLSGDVVYIAWSLVAVQLLMFLIKYWMIVRKHIGPCFAPYVRAAGIPILLASGMSVVVLGTGAVLTTVPDAVRLGAQVLVGALAYSSLAWIFHGKYLRNAINLIWNRR